MYVALGALCGVVATLSVAGNKKKGVDWSIIRSLATWQARKCTFAGCYQRTNGNDRKM
jgi:hypothetical protein